MLYLLKGAIMQDGKIKDIDTEFHAETDEEAVDLVKATPFVDIRIFREI